MIKIEDLFGKIILTFAVILLGSVTALVVGVVVMMWRWALG